MNLLYAAHVNLTFYASSNSTAVNTGIGSKLDPEKGSNKRKVLCELTIIIVGNFIKIAHFIRLPF